jgi:hypothetical protein
MACDFPVFRENETAINQYQIHSSLRIFYAGYLLIFFEFLSFIGFTLHPLTLAADEHAQATEKFFPPSC